MTIPIFSLNQIYQVNFPMNSSELPDVLHSLLAKKSNPHTRRAYHKDLTDFFGSMGSDVTTKELVIRFLQLPQTVAVELIQQYKSQLKKQGLRQATINRKIAAIKSLVSYARKIGVCNYSLKQIKNEAVSCLASDDERRISSDSFVKVLKVLQNENTLKNKRDYALLKLLWDNQLKRGQIVTTNVEDFDSNAKTLKIKAKRNNSKKITVNLSTTTAAALQTWVQARTHVEPDSPLFIALDKANVGHRLTGAAIYWIVSSSFKMAGIERTVSPQALRQSSLSI